MKDEFVDKYLAVLNCLVMTVNEFNLISNKLIDRSFFFALSFILFYAYIFFFAV